jgi:NADPH-dependent curcumin reductase CurA
MRVPDEKYPKDSYDIFQMKIVPPTPIDELKDNEVVVRNLYISIDATMRVWISGVQSYLPPVKPQDVMRAFCVGKVIYSKSGNFKVGDLVLGMLGWQKFAVMNQK